MLKIPQPLSRLWKSATRMWRDELRPIFNLRLDLDEAGTLEAVERTSEFRGAGTWTLIFAILIASIGLNVNSTAVIIGAMLISPLMGPIVGCGLALGINNFDLMKRALRSLLTATVVGIGASFVYFLISPLGEAQGELLARTQPTIYDVLIAVCGGATGIIAVSRKERSANAISGVAIATALMPPLCTAGYGLANGHLSYVIGALYLYAINSIFICLSTFVIVRTLRFKKHVFLDQKTERRVGLYMAVFAVLVAIPSVYTAYQTVSDAMFRTQANRFLAESFRSSETKILERRVERLAGGNVIELTLIGKSLEPDERKQLEERLPLYGLKGTVLTLNEAGSRTIKDMEARLSQSLTTELMQRFYTNNQDLIKTKDDKIRLLEEELLKYKRNEQIVDEMGVEAAALAVKVESMSVGEMPSWNKTGGKSTPVSVVIVRWKGKASQADKALIGRFVRARLKVDRCEVFHESV